MIIRHGFSWKTLLQRKDEQETKKSQCRRHVLKKTNDSWQRWRTQQQHPSPQNSSRDSSKRAINFCHSPTKGTIDPLPRSLPPWLWRDRQHPQFTNSRTLQNFHWNPGSQTLKLWNTFTTKNPRIFLQIAYARKKQAPNSLQFLTWKKNKRDQNGRFAKKKMSSNITS